MIAPINWVLKTKWLSFSGKQIFEYMYILKKLEEKYSIFILRIKKIHTDSIYFFRLPSDQSRRKQWSDTIMEHQKLDESIQQNVCELHFKSSDFTPNRKLKIIAYPTIFPSWYVKSYGLFSFTLN